MPNCASAMPLGNGGTMRWPLTKCFSGTCLPEVAERMAPLVGPGTSIITAMNGVPWWFFDRLRFGGGKLRLESLDPGGRLARAIPTERIVGCVIHLAASTPEPGLILHNMGA